MHHQESLPSRVVFYGCSSPISERDLIQLTMFSMSLNTPIKNKDYDRRIRRFWFSHSVVSNSMDCSTPVFPVHHQLPELTQTHVHQVGDAIQPSHSLSSPFPPSVFASIRVFSKESVLCIRWPKYWSFSFNISPSSEYSGLISFRINWFDLLAIQGTLKCLLQHHSSKLSVLQCSAFFTVQFSHSYMTTGKTIPLTIQDLCQQSNVSTF